MVVGPVAVLPDEPGDAVADAEGREREQRVEDLLAAAPGAGRDVQPPEGVDARGPEADDEDREQQRAAERVAGQREQRVEGPLEARERPRAVGEPAEVRRAEHLLDDEGDAEQRDREEVLAQADGRQRDERADEPGGQRPDEDGRDPGPAEAEDVDLAGVLRGRGEDEQRRGVGADEVERDVADLQEARVAELDVEPDGEQREDADGGPERHQAGGHRHLSDPPRAPRA